MKNRKVFHIHWLIGVKCRKITHGYCTLEIVYRDCKFKLHRDYNAHNTTRTSQAREFKFKSILYVSTHGVTFMHALIRNCMRHCASQFDSSSTLLFNAGSQHINVICAQQQGVLMEMHSSSKIHIYTSSIFYFITLFRFAGARMS